MVSQDDLEPRGLAVDDVAKSESDEHKKPRVPLSRRRGARYRARRRAADILYEAEARDIDPVAIVEERVRLSLDDVHAVAPVAEYTQEIVRGAAVELDAIDDAIARYLSSDWELFRIPAVDRAIMRVAAWELLFNPEVPRATAVVDGVEMASEYSNDAAPPYIHVVLDEIAQSQAPDNPLSPATDTAPADDAADAAGPRMGNAIRYSEWLRRSGHDAD